MGCKLLGERDLHTDFVPLCPCAWRSPAVSTTRAVAWERVPGAWLAPRTLALSQGQFSEVWAHCSRGSGSLCRTQMCAGVPRTTTHRTLAQFLEHTCKPTPRECGRWCRPGHMQMEQLSPFGQNTRKAVVMVKATQQRGSTQITGVVNIINIATVGSRIRTPLRFTDCTVVYVLPSLVLEKTKNAYTLNNFVKRKMELLCTLCLFTTKRRRRERTTNHLTVKKTSHSVPQCNFTSVVSMDCGYFFPSQLLFFAPRPRKLGGGKMEQGCVGWMFLLRLWQNLLVFIRTAVSPATCCAHRAPSCYLIKPRAALPTFPLHLSSPLFFLVPLCCVLLWNRVYKVFCWQQIFATSAGSKKNLSLLAVTRALVKF